MVSNHLLGSFLNVMVVSNILFHFHPEIWCKKTSHLTNDSTMNQWVDGLTAHQGAGKCSTGALCRGLAAFRSHRREHGWHERGEG